MPAKNQPAGDPAPDAAAVEPAAAPAPPAEAAPAAEDDVKRRFREALERKHGQHGDGAGGQGREGGKGAGRSHGPARTQRTFRRKSG